MVQSKGPDVPDGDVDRKVAIYRSLTPGFQKVGPSAEQLSGENGAGPRFRPQCSWEEPHNEARQQLQQFDGCDRVKQRAPLDYLHTQIATPLFRTRIGKTFRRDKIREAMMYETEPGAKAILVAKGELWRRLGETVTRGATPLRD
jgi:hypothetical protein